MARVADQRRCPENLADAILGGEAEDHIPVFL
jgi:hypothetical protein